MTRRFVMRGRTRTPGRDGANRCTGSRTPKAEPASASLTRTGMTTISGGTTSPVPRPVIGVARSRPPAVRRPVCAAGGHRRPEGGQDDAAPGHHPPVPQGEGARRSRRPTQSLGPRVQPAAGLRAWSAKAARGCDPIALHIGAGHLRGSVAAPGGRRPQALRDAMERRHAHVPSTSDRPDWARPVAPTWLPATAGWAPGRLPAAARLALGVEVLSAGPVSPRAEPERQRPPETRRFPGAVR